MGVAVGVRRLWNWVVDFWSPEAQDAPIQPKDPPPPVDTALLQEKTPPGEVRGQLRCLWADLGGFPEMCPTRRQCCLVNDALWHGRGNLAPQGDPDTPF